MKINERQVIQLNCPECSFSSSFLYFYFAVLLVNESHFLLDSLTTTTTMMMIRMLIVAADCLLEVTCYPPSLEISSSLARRLA